MQDENFTKYYPAASDEMVHMLGLTVPKPPQDSLPKQTTEEVSASLEIPKPAEYESLPITSSSEPATNEVDADNSILKNIPSLQEKAPALVQVGKILLAVLPYVVVFAIGAIVYYAFLANPANRPQFFQSFAKKEPDPIVTKQKTFATLQKNNQGDFVAWINSYYYTVTDASLVGMNYVAPNKLTNFENYLLKINPKTNDVMHTGKTDAENVLAGIDPATGTSLADWQRDIVAQYFDSAAITQRFGGVVAPATVLPTVAGTRTVLMPRGEPADSVSAQTIAVATLTPTPTPVPTKTPVVAVPVVVPTVRPTTQNPSNCSDNTLQINTSIPGRLEVPSIGVNVPIIWSTSTNNFDADLKTGVVHYPCTPLPGDVGTSYISGHSSNYAWVHADYNKVFARINELANGTTFKITVVGKDGKDIRLFYVVQEQKVFEPSDQAQFINTAQSRVALSTCWPINSTKQRRVAYGVLNRTER